MYTGENLKLINIISKGFNNIHADIMVYNYTYH